MAKEGERLLEEGKGKGEEADAENESSKKCTKTKFLTGLLVFSGLVNAGTVIAYVNYSPPPCPVTYPRCFSYTADNFKMTAEYGAIMTLPLTVQDRCVYGTYPPKWTNASFYMLYAPSAATHEMLVIGPVIGYPTPDGARQRAVEFINLDYLWPMGKPLLDPSLDYACVSRKGEFVDGPSCEKPSAFALRLGSDAEKEFSDDESMPELVNETQAALPKMSESQHILFRKVFNRLIQNAPEITIDSTHSLKIASNRRSGF